MESDKQQEAFSIIDPSDSYALKAKRNVTGTGCLKGFTKGLILFIAFVLAVLCAVAIVLVIMLYVRPIIETEFDSQMSRVEELEMILNETIKQAAEFDSQMSRVEELEMILNETIKQAAEAEELRMRLNVSQVAAAMEIAMLKTDIADARAEISSLETDKLGTVYINFGSNSCPAIDGTEMVYSGYMAGNDFGSQGGGSSFLCLPTDPDITGINFEAGVRSASILSGIEYEASLFGNSENNEQAACSVCSVRGRSRVLMQPGKTICPDTWTTEYFGYLATEGILNRRTEYVCINERTDTVPGLSGHQQSGDLWTVEPRCNSLLCPPYNEEVEIGCSVCTK